VLITSVITVETNPNSMTTNQQRHRQTDRQTDRRASNTALARRASRGNI